VVARARQGGFEDRIEGQVRNSSSGKVLAIPGLWALLPGTAATGGTGSIWFSAGIDNEQHGPIGVLRHP
jgi:hypothetical protein